MSINIYISGSERVSKKLDEMRVTGGGFLFIEKRCVIDYDAEWRNTLEQWKKIIF
jgi:hypothetical protein